MMTDYQWQQLFGSIMEALEKDGEVTVRLLDNYGLVSLKHGGLETAWRLEDGIHS